jgi:hypothetical protein
MLLIALNDMQVSLLVGLGRRASIWQARNGALVPKFRLRPRLNWLQQMPIR